MASNVTCADLLCCRDRWVIDPSDTTIIEDRTTGKRYRNISPSEIREKACCLSTVGFVGNILGSVIMVSKRALKLASCYHYWCCFKAAPDSSHGATYPPPKRVPHTCKERSIEVLKDAGKIAISPVTLLGAEVSACCAICFPRCGAKSYVFFEGAIYHDYTMVREFVDSKHPRFPSQYLHL